MDALCAGRFENQMEVGLQASLLGGRSWPGGDAQRLEQSGSEIA
jgi:hypothetical protein